MSTKEESLNRLRDWFPEGSTVFTILRHRSASGMSRVIGIVALPCIDGKPEPLHPNYAVATVLGLKEDREREGVKVGGCGMDMGFHVAYELARVLYGNGYALKHRWL